MALCFLAQHTDKTHSVATTTSTSLVASESRALLLEEDNVPQIVMLVKDEHGTEFMFSDAMPDTLGHSELSRPTRLFSRLQTPRSSV